MLRFFRRVPQVDQSKEGGALNPMTAQDFNAIQKGSVVSINKAKYVAQRLENGVWELARLRDMKRIYLQKVGLDYAYESTVTARSGAGLLRRDFSRFYPVNRFEKEAELNQ
jgi:hypothetical protein